ncbi:DM13 domain-containing protein [Haloferax larsenii]|uniref:DM13 domain-containing protein n=1 Tax=Haloferax larsenii TaxID=302484 RepID=A0ABY5R9F4_HALLR|nr:DM13 domain-containing protein [Haloferax larsenii]UVE48972.1 DM13 domain-containing protein [Haloferax larsenii]
MKRRTLLGLVGGGVALTVGGAAAAELFLPERATRVTDEGGAVDATPLSRGSFVGKTGHKVSGTVTLARNDEGHVLQFEDYEQTQGPDVFVYLTPQADPDTKAAVDDGVKVLIDGGEDGGESTKLGTFTQRLEDVGDPTRFRGVAIWCDRFSTPFGAATLSPVE